MDEVVSICETYSQNWKGTFIVWKKQNRDWDNFNEKTCTLMNLLQFVKLLLKIGRTISVLGNQTRDRGHFDGKHVL